jgi:chromosome partitioning protein
MAARHRPGDREAPSMRVVTITNLKGGSGKSTTAGLLIHAWLRLGYRVLGIDADPQGTLTRWAEDAEWPVSVIGMATKKIHQDLPGIVSPERFDVVVIDTPPLEQEGGIVHSAMRAATDVVVTLAPTASEWDALPRVWDALEDVDTLRTRPAPVSVLWNRVRANTTAARLYRETLTDAGHYCLRASIPLAERYAQAVGAPVTFRPDDTAVIDAAEELAKRGGWA